MIAGRSRVAEVWREVVPEAVQVEVPEVQSWVVKLETWRVDEGRLLLLCSRGSSLLFVDTLLLHLMVGQQRSSRGWRRWKETSLRDARVHLCRARFAWTKSVAQRSLSLAT